MIFFVLIIANTGQSFIIRPNKKIFFHWNQRTISSFMTRFVTRLIRQVPLVEQELLTFSEHLSSPPVFSGVHVTRSLVLYVMFCRSLFVLLSFFLLAIMLSIFLWFTDSNYPFGILDLQILITPLVSSNLSYIIPYYHPLWRTF